MEQDIKILEEKRNVSEAAFKLHFPEVYSRVQEWVKPLNVTRWNEAKYIYKHQLKSLPTCKICGKPVGFKSMKRGYKSTCSRECDIKCKSQTQKTNKAIKNEQNKVEPVGTSI